MEGDALTQLATIRDEAVNTIVTSPPYYGLRDYGVEGQIGREISPDAYVAALVSVFHEAKRVLRSDGTFWLNIGDSYAANRTYQVASTKGGDKHGSAQERTGGSKVPDGLKPKDLIGIPWMLAFALRADGWYLRSDIIWHKPNVMPSSVKDRVTTAHEYMFMLTKSAKYAFNADAIREPHQSAYSQDAITKAGHAGGVRPEGNNFSKQNRWEDNSKTPRTRADRAALLNPRGRNRRSVWAINTKPLREAHFATFPEALVEPCILSGCPAGGTVLDPFSGAATTGVVALKQHKNYIGIELNPEYNQIAKRRLEAVIQPGVAA
jgi:DNA modification methylase